jgi:hypothetical protein
MPADVVPGITTHDDGGPLGRPVRVPWLDHPAIPGVWRAALVGLTGTTPEPPLRSPAVHVAFDGPYVHVVWPDAVRTRTRLDLPSPATKEEG